MVFTRASLVARLVKNPPALRETWVQSLGREDPPGEGKGYPLQYSGLENSMEGVAKLDRTERLSFSAVLSIFVLLRIHPLVLHLVKLKLCPRETLSTPSSPRQPPFMLSISVSGGLWGTYVIGITLCDWLMSLSMATQFIHAVALL